MGPELDLVIEEIHLLYGGFHDLLFAEEVGETKAVSRGFNGDDVGQDHLLFTVLYHICVGLTHLEYPPDYNNNRSGWVLSTQTPGGMGTGFY